MKTMEMAMKKALVEQVVKQVKETFAKQEVDWRKPRVYDAKLVTVKVGEKTVIFPKPLTVEVHGYLDMGRNGNDGIEQSNSEL